MKAGVLLIQPELGFEATFPLGLATLATTLRARGHRVHGSDMRINVLPGTLTMHGARPDLIVIDTSIRNAHAVARVLEALPQAIPKIVIGAAAVLHPAYFIHAGAIGVVTGDPEAVVPAMIEGDVVDVAERPGLVTGKQATRDCPINPVAWVGKIPPADRHVFPARVYGGHPFRKGERRHAAIETSRGCPFNCLFCPVPARFGGNHRVRPVDDVVDEVGRLNREFEVTSLWIEDEQPLADIGHFRNLLAVLRRDFKNVELELPNGLRPDLLDDDLIDELAFSGCKRLAIGIESGSEDVRERLNRPISDDRLRQIVNRCRSKGIIAAGYFMIGLPGESYLDRAKTLTAASMLDLPYSHISVFWPFSELAHQNERLESVRALGYAMIYLNPMRALSLARHGDVSIGSLPRAVSMLKTWVGAGSTGGGGW